MGHRGLPIMHSSHGNENRHCDYDHCNNHSILAPKRVISRAPQKQLRCGNSVPNKRPPEGGVPLCPDFAQAAASVTLCLRLR